MKSVKDKYGLTKKRLVAYSLGNFVSSQFRRYTNGGIIFHFSIVKIKNEVKIRNVGYTPVYVHVYSEKSGFTYSVLPVYKYLGKALENLDPFSRKSMLEFLKDTEIHLSESAGNLIDD
jgi:poly-gamma-glutamate synthesis protein (capsule biosynthesis protein)